jgi:Rho GDP-dissociation inhibitor
MSEEEAQAAAQATAADDEDEVTPGYTAPKKVDLKTLQELDADDESLVKYKAQLLGQTTDVKDEGGANVLVQQLILEPTDHAAFTLDLNGDLAKLKDSPITVKEGCEYRVKIVFRVQRDIVSGLRYAQNSYRKGIKVDKSNLMVGSYGPKTESHVYQTPLETAPSGMISRGSYNIKSKFTDDDKNSIKEWDWVLNIKKDWA